MVFVIELCTLEEHGALALHVEEKGRQSSGSKWLTYARFHQVKARLTENADNKIGK